MKADFGGGLSLNYELHGPERAPWVAFSHSLMCSLRMWESQVAAFARDYRVLVYDMRGHGLSSAPSGAYSLAELADDFARLLAHLRAPRVHFVGLSIGGMIGLTLALARPESLQSLVVCDTGHTQSAEAIAQWRERIAIARSKGMEALVEPTVKRWFTAASLGRGGEALESVRRQIRSTSVDGYVGCCHAIMGLDLTARLGEVRVPTLAIAGEQDASAPGTRHIGAHVPGAKLVLIPQAGHISNVEQPEAFNAALLEHLREHT